MLRSRFSRAVALAASTATVLAAGTVTGALTTTAAVAAPGPAVSLSAAGPYSDGQTVTVSGTGFSGDDPGLYVGLVQDDRFSVTDAGAWMTTAYLRPAQISGGRWSIDVTLPATTDVGDCTENACSIYTVAAHGSDDRSQDTKTPVSFTSPAPTTAPTTTQAPPTTTTTTPPPTTSTSTRPPTATRPPATTRPPASTTPAAPQPGNGPRVSLDRSTGLNAAGDTVTVSGQGFSTSGPGLYVGLAQTDRFSPTDAAVFHEPVFVRPEQLAGGRFSTRVPVVGAFSGGDCMRSECAIYTLAAHGSSDRSQDTVSRVSFTGTAPAVTPGAGGGTGGGAGAGTAAGGSGGTGGVVTVADGGPSAAGTTFAENAALSVSVSKATDIDPAGETVTVSGSGFSGAAPGLYVGLVQDDKFSATNADVWMTSAFLRPAEISGGSWSVSMDLAATGAAGSDCMVNTCSIYTVAAHGSSDRSQDSRTPVSFLGGVQPAGGSAPGAATAAAQSEGPEGFVAGDVTVTLSKSEDLDPAGELVTVTGADFSGEGAGIYVGLVEDDRFSVTDAAAWMTTAWIGSGEIVDGEWTAEIELPARHGESDCTVNQCAVYTIAAHGSPDRSQDSRTPVSFSGAAAGSTSGAHSATASGRQAESSSSTDLTWLWILVGVLGGAGVALGGVFVARRVRGTGPGA